MLPDLIGSLAAFLTTVAYLPQAVKVIRERDTHAISRDMYIIMCLGIAMWVLYGVLQGSYPLIIGNSITLALTVTILVMKIRLG
jgi:MtN3 and saliva related transmembrane protein